MLRNSEFASINCHIAQQPYEARLAMRRAAPTRAFRMEVSRKAVERHAALPWRTVTMRRIFPSLLACSASLVSTEVAAAEKCTAVNTGQLHISMPFTSGLGCVQLIPAWKQLCVEGATRVAEISVQIVHQYNAQWPSTFSNPAGPGCFNLGLQARTANHAGHHPFYTCSPGELRAVVHAKFCSDTVAE